MCNKNWDTSFRIMNKRFAYVCIKFPLFDIIFIISFLDTQLSSLLLFFLWKLSAQRWFFSQARSLKRDKSYVISHAIRHMFVACQRDKQRLKTLKYPDWGLMAKNSRNPIKGMTWKSRGGSMLENVANTIQNNFTLKLMSVWQDFFDLWHTPNTSDSTLFKASKMTHLGP